MKVNKLTTWFINVTLEDIAKKYTLELAEREWKSGFYNHKLSFKHKRYSNKTTLSSYM